MRFGVRDIANVVFKAKTSQKIGSKNFRAGQPVLYIDTAKTSTLEQATTTVYAQGGRGNARLIAWEGQKTLTFTVEDALLSPMGLAVLSGAGLIHSTNPNETKKVHVHMTSNSYLSVDEGGTATIDLTDALSAQEKVCDDAPIFVMKVERDGSLTGDMITGCEVDESGKKITVSDDTVDESCNVFVDYYVIKTEYNTHELQIGAENFGGSYYVEADTLFRDQETGKDMPANLTIPNVKIQSNFTFNMAATGDPSTFTFTMDAFPGYTMFNSRKKVLCVIQIIDEKAEDMVDDTSVMVNPAQSDYNDDIVASDSTGAQEETH